MIVERLFALVSRILQQPWFLFAALTIGILLAGRSAMLRDPGTFWHVAAGEWMLRSGEILRADPFSFTFFGRPWTDDQWLAECGMATVVRSWGWDGLLLAVAVILSAFFAWLATRLLQTGLNLLPTVLLLGLVLLMASPQFHLRPLILTMVLLGVTMALLVDVESGRKSVRQLWWLTPLFAVWANLHGGVLAGIGSAGLCLAGWIVFGLPDSKPRVGRLGWRLELILLGSSLLLATVVNPYGLALPGEWLETLRMPLPALLDEHRPLTLDDFIIWAVFASAAVYLVALLGTWPRRPRLTWLVPLLWFVFALLRVRNAALFGIVGMVALADMLPHSSLGRWLERREWLASRRTIGRWQLLVAPLAVVLAAVGFSGTGMPARLSLTALAEVDSQRWPVALLPKLDTIARKEHAPVAIFNDLNFGGFLIYYQPRMQVFVDDRCSLYGQEFLLEYDRARRIEPERIDAWRQQYGFRYALVERGNAFDRYLGDSRQWALLGRSESASLYEYQRAGKGIERR